jgi:hydroxyethylthiazole kinase
MKPNAYDLLERVRQRRPVVHHLTNWVTIYDCAQVVKTLGASPVMAHAAEEVSDMAQIASALVLNIGTLTPDFVKAMKLAAMAAELRLLPVVLDVCGAGATRLRDQKSQELLETGAVSVIKGNASEIARVSGQNVSTRGVDTGEVAQDLVLLARRLARQRKATVVVTGKVDVVTNGQRTYLVKNGHELLTHVVGTGCMAASVIGTFTAVEADFALAATCGLACYGIAAELAARNARGPATFKTRLFDCLYGLDRKTVETRQKLEVL